MFRRNGRRFGGAALAAAMIVVLAAAGPARAAGPSCISARYPALAHGFNLAGWFDNVPRRPPPEGSLAGLRKLGMTHVRLPIAADSVIAAFAGEAPARAQVAAIGAAVRQLLALDYAVMVDLHGSPDLFRALRADASAGGAHILSAWQAMAPVLQGLPPDRVFAELLNEPPLEGEAWATLQTALVPRVRALLPDTPLILSTGGPQRVEALVAAEPVQDPNTIYAVHYYDPFFFTHQGADWISEEPAIAAIREMPFPIPPASPKIRQIQQELRGKGFDAVAAKLDEFQPGFGPDDIDAHMKAIEAWTERTGRPVVINEFGVYRGKALPSDRIGWLRAVTRGAGAHCLGWTHWEYRDGFGFVDPDTGKPDALVVRALLGPAAR